MADQLDWFFDNDGSESGPYTTEEINRRIKDGIIIADTLVWRKGMADWQHAKDTPDLADWFVRPPPFDERAHQSANPSVRQPAQSRKDPTIASANVSDADRLTPIPKPTPIGDASSNPQPKPVSMHAQSRAQERERRRRGVTGLLWIGLFAIVGVICAVLAGLLLNFDLPFGDPATEQADQTQPDVQLEDLSAALLASRYGDSLRVIRNYQPTEFEVVIEQLSGNIGGDRSEESIDRLAAEVTNFFETRYRRYASHAPDNVLRAVVETRIANLEAVLKIYPEQCATFVIDGAGSLGEDREVVLAPLLFAQTTALLSAYFEGQKSGEVRPAAEDSDLGSILDNWEAEGVNEELLRSLETPERSDPNFCPATLSMLRAVARSDGDAAVRVRASLVGQIANN